MASDHQPSRRSIRKVRAGAAQEGKAIGSGLGSRPRYVCCVADAGGQKGRDRWGELYPPLVGIVGLTRRR